MGNSERLTEIVAWADRLYRDYRLAAVREWKARTGGLADRLPADLRPARAARTRRACCRSGLMGGGDDLEIIQGDAYYQSYICHIPRSTIELGLNGSLDCLDGMLLPGDLRRDPQPLRHVADAVSRTSSSRYLDVPQNFDPAIGRRASTARELEALSRELDRARRAAATTPRRCARRSRSTTRTAALVRELYALRRAQPWKVPTSELYLLLRAGPRAAGRGADARCSRDYRDARRGRRRRASRSTRRACCVTGLVLRAAAARPHQDARARRLLHRRRRLRAGAPLDPVGHPDRRAIRSTRSCAPSSTTSIGQPDALHRRRREGRGARARASQASGAEGVLFCAPSFCDPALLDQPMAVARGRAARASRGPRSSTPRTPASSR